MVKLSIVIPVYNVERYVRTCMESIYGQGLREDDYEVIVVNDGTPDGSMDMVADLVAAHRNTIVIDQPNQGLSVARNNGLARATGEYVLFVDSDDLLLPAVLPRLLDLALTSGADMVVADFLRMDDGEIAAFMARKSGNADGGSAAGNATVEAAAAADDAPVAAAVVSGEQLLLQLNPRYFYVWRTLHRRAFLAGAGITFVPGLCFEDNPFTHECYLRAGRCLRVSTPIYIYRVGHPSITSERSLAKAHDYASAIALTWQLSYMPGLSPEVRQRVRDNVFELFSVLVYGISHDGTPLGGQLAVLRHLRRQAPALRFRGSVKQRAVDFGFRYVPRLYLTLRTYYARFVEPRLCR